MNSSLEFALFALAMGTLSVLATGDGTSPLVEADSVLVLVVVVVGAEDATLDSTTTEVRAGDVRKRLEILSRTDYTHEYQYQRQNRKTEGGSVGQ